MASITLAVLALGSGCGDSGVHGPMDGGGHMLDDGHIQTGCFVDSDCAEGNKCRVPHCNVVTHKCENSDMFCSPTRACTMSSCEPTSGLCFESAGDEGATCTTTGSGQNGTCMGGTCVPLPTCYDPFNSYNPIDCTDYYRVRTDENSINSFNATNVMTQYKCATNETGYEVAYDFYPYVSGLVTVELTPTGAPGSPDMGTFDADLDLIVLDSTCDSSAACMNPALPGGTYAGITAGTGHETVQFTVTQFHQYYIVVEGKNAAAAQYKLEIKACGGGCVPAATTTLACGMSIAGNTAMGTSNLASYTCDAGGGSTTTVNAPGNEQAFFWETVADVPQNVRATVTNPSAPVLVQAVPGDYNIACDPTTCAGTQSIAQGATGALTFAAQPPFSTTYAPNIYWVVVDTATTGADATFGLQLDCLPYCNASGDAVYCQSHGSGSSLPAGANNGNLGSTNALSAWGPTASPCSGLTNLSGPEYVVLFTSPNEPPGTHTYQVTLGALTATKKLGLVVLDQGTTQGACDPTATCASTTATNGYVSTGPTTTGGLDGTATTVTITNNRPGVSYYWLVIDGVNGDVSDFALKVEPGC